MDDATWPWSSLSTFEETFEALSEVLRPARETQRANLQRLQELVRQSEAPAMADDATAPAEDVSAEPVPGAAPRIERLTTERSPQVVLPRRTTHGGDFGPAVRQKLIAEALGKGRTW